MKRLLPLLSLLLLGCAIASPVKAPTSTPPTLQPLSYRTQTLDRRAIAHIVTIPNDRRYQVKPALSSIVQTVDQLTQTALVGINAGFFDPSNQQTTSHIVINQVNVANPQTNSRLVDNPKLKPYLNQIFDRSEFRRYNCQDQTQYRIQRHSQPGLPNCQLIDAIGAGPALLPELTAEPEAFLDPTTGRDPIGINQPNARSAIGITADQQILLVMVAQTAIGGGITLPDLAKLMQSLGAVQALNLDGGTSSAIFYQNQLIYGKRNQSHQPEGRPVKSAIVVTISGNPADRVLPDPIGVR
jgi:Phosphodiester glycosidase